MMLRPAIKNNKNFYPSCNSYGHKFQFVQYGTNLWVPFNLFNAGSRSVGMKWEKTFWTYLNMSNRNTSFSVSECFLLFAHTECNPGVHVSELLSSKTGTHSIFVIELVCEERIGQLSEVGLAERADTVNVLQVHILIEIWGSLTVKLTPVWRQTQHFTAVHRHTNASTQTHTPHLP